MKFSIGIIVKNESQNLDHLAIDLKDFINNNGDVVILDTGSTDDTIEKGKKLGFRVECCKKSFLTTISSKNLSKIDKYCKFDKNSINKTYFNFSKARNELHYYVKNNMILQLDASQHLINFDFNFINNLIINDKIQQFSYINYYSSLENIKTPSINTISRFYNKKQYEWVRYVHEHLSINKNIYKYSLPENILSMRHIKNNNKERNYLAGLFDDFIDHPNNPRCIYYLARDLIYIKNYDCALSILKLYLNIDKKNVWIAELSGVHMLIADCYYNINNIEMCYIHLFKAHSEFSGWREPLIKLSYIYLYFNKLTEALEQALNSLKYKKESDFVESFINYTYLPHELIYKICHKLYIQTNDKKYLSLGILNLNKCIEFDDIFLCDKNLFKKDLIPIPTEIKHVIVFYLSYAGIKDNNIYGSELACIKLSEHLTKKGYNVIILDDISRTDNKYINGVYYLDVNLFKMYEKYYIIDILIISRYINYFIDFNFKAKKIFLWIHDTELASFYKGTTLNNMGYNLFKNCIHKINNIITLTDWHSLKIIENYDFIENNKINIIGNGIDTSLFKYDILNKIKYKFIWCSHLNRGIERTVLIFKEILKIIPEATLHIFRDFIGYEDYINTLKDFPSIIFYGNTNNNKIIGEFASTDIWLYPTIWEETYCITALEAALSNTFIIYNNIGALKDTVGDRGIEIDKNIINNPKLVCDFILNELKNEEKIKILKEKGYEFALQQDWNLITDKWIELFNE